MYTRTHNSAVVGVFLKQINERILSNYIEKKWNDMKKYGREEEDTNIFNYYLYYWNAYFYITYGKGDDGSLIEGMFRKEIFIIFLNFITYA